MDRPIEEEVSSGFYQQRGQLPSGLKLFESGFDLAESRGTGILRKVSTYLGSSLRKISEDFISASGDQVTGCQSRMGQSVGPLCASDRGRELLLTQLGERKYRPDLWIHGIC